MRSLTVGPLLVAAAAVGCAQPGTPPGGEVDRVPPRVVEVAPAALDTLKDLRAPVTIRFDERISERLEGVRSWDEAVIVSPVTSPVKVDRGHRDLEVSLVRGWEPNMVYRVVVRPVYRDLFGNARTEPIELVFSTGAPIPESALAGFVIDGLTGAGVPDARVEAVRRGEQARYVAVTDTAGFFAMTFMPDGAFDIRSWVDQDRSLEPDFFELQDSARVSFEARDTAIVELALLRPDTTPARLARAEPLDSMRVRLHFDDHFAVGPVTGQAVLYSLPDTTRLGAARLIHPARLDSLLAVEAEAAELRELTAAVLDSLRAAPEPDTAQTELEQTAAVIARERVSARQAGRSARRSEPPLPSRQLILVSPVRFEPDSAYQVRVTGVTNIQGVGGGGGAVSFTMPPPPPPEPEPAPEELPPDTGRDTVPKTVPDTVPDTVPGGPRREG